MHGQEGPVQESNLGPLAPGARIMPLDQQASHKCDVSEKKGTMNVLEMLQIHFSWVTKKDLY